MTILKAGSRISARDACSGFPVRRSAGMSAAYVPSRGVSSLSSSSPDTSDGEPVETMDVHFFQVGDKMCEIPPELLDVSDLRQILSIDAWNTLLTEEDRATLVPFLPQMDEFTYSLTLTELFSGENFNFSSPLEDLLQLLRSGQCHPNVAPYRDALIFLQHREHFHQVRRFHNHMVNNFLEMQHLWKEYADSDLKEKMKVWKSWKLEKPRPFSGNLDGNRGCPELHYPLSLQETFLNAKENHNVSQALTVVDSADSAVIVKSTAYRQPRKGSRTTNDAGYKTAASAAFETINEPRLKGAPKLLSKVSGRSRPMMQPDEIGTQPILPYGQMQPMISSVYKVDDSFENMHVPVSTTCPPAVMLDVESFPTSLTNEKVSLKMNLESKVKVPGYKKTKGMLLGDGKMKESDTFGDPKNNFEQDINIVKQQQLEFSPALARRGLDISFPPIHIERHSPSVEIDNRTKGKKKRKIKIEQQSPLEHSDQDVLMRMSYSEEAYLAEKEMQDILDDKDILHTDEKSTKRKRKKLKSADIPSIQQSCNLNGEASLVEPAKNLKKAPLQVPPVAMNFPFSVVHLLSAVRSALIAQHVDESPLINWGNNQNANDDRSYMMAMEATYSQLINRSFLREGTGEEQQEKRSKLSVISLQEILKRVQDNPGDPRILETQEPLQGLIRGALKVLSTKTLQPGIKGWKPLVAYDKESKGWSWIGPATSSKDYDGNELEIIHEIWSVPQKTFYKLQECFANWLKNEQEILQKLGQLALIPPPLTTAVLDEKERFRELRAQKSLMTISPTSEEMRSYFRREEELRYSVPDRVFSYTCLDGRKSAVAPLRRIGGKPNSKARDHFMLKSDRPPHVTILCLVRDAAARLPGNIGTRADVCALIRDSQYIVEDVSDVQLNQVVSGALDRLHYERDPCVRFDADRKLWVYLHADKDDEDFEEDATSSTKRWKRTKKEGVENPDLSLLQDYEYQLQDDQDSCGLGFDFSPTTCFGQSDGLSSVYASTGRPELLFTHPNGSLTSLHGHESAFACQGREEAMLPFIEMPPSIQPPSVHMQQSHPMGWEVFANRWDHDLQLQSNDHIVHDFNALTSRRDNEIMIDRGA